MGEHLADRPTHESQTPVSFLLQMLTWLGEGQLVNGCKAARMWGVSGHQQCMVSWG